MIKLMKNQTKRLFIYLAGNLTYFKNQGEEIYKYKVLKWRNEISNWLQDNNISSFNPADTFDKEQAHFYSGKSVVYQNIHYLNKSDILIVDLSELDKSFGAMFEIVYAREVLNIPIIAFGECEVYKYSPHLKECITESFKSFDDVIDYISTMYL